MSGASRTLRVSVTTLADFSCREGDLGFDAVAGPSAIEGIRAHQRVQKSRAGIAEAEVKLNVKREIDDIKLTLTGRVDLLNSQLPSLSEIKTVVVPHTKIAPSQQTLHWAQLKLYGYCYWLQRMDSGEPLVDNSLALELIYTNIRNNEETCLVQHVDLFTLQQFAQQAIDQYIKWYRIVWAWQEASQQSAKALLFPHPQFRAGQRDMAAAIYRVLRDKSTLLCEAPTGTGKTISALFPAIKALGEGQVKHALYLTAKTSGRNSAMHSVRLLEKSGLQITSILIRSKQLSCFCSIGRCERSVEGHCPMTIGFFDRLPAAREQLMSLGVIDGEQLDDVAWQHSLCPFELALQMLPWVSLVVCDFNYVFDPLVRLERFNESRSDTALLIDEAHNLVDRSRSMYSAELSRLSCLEAAKQIKQSHPQLSRRLSGLANALMRHSKTLIETELVQYDCPQALVKACSSAIEAQMQAVVEESTLPDTLFELFNALYRFNAISEVYAPVHRTITQVAKIGASKEVTVQLKCLDAANFLNPIYQLFRGCVVFSATLRPAPFFRDALGLPTQTQQLLLASPFAPDHAIHQVVCFIDTRYRQREHSAEKLLGVLAAMVKGKPGNYMVFFPSYAYLEQIQRLFNKRYPHIETWSQPRNSDNEQREQLMQRLELSGTRLGFAIIGGVFGEGVDYIGERLIGVAIVGVGLPAFNAEQELIAAHYRSQKLDGFDYAYRYPGFIRVLQTAGRVIRSESDKGLVLLIDDRFKQSFYKELFPDHWRITMVNEPQKLAQGIDLFWKQFSMSDD